MFFILNEDTYSGSLMFQICLGKKEADSNPQLLICRSQATEDS